MGNVTPAQLPVLAGPLADDDTMMVFPGLGPLQQFPASKLKEFLGGASLLLDGTSAMTGPVKAADGTLDNPSMVFASDTNTGFYKYGSDQLGVAAGGLLQAIISSTGIQVLTNLLFKMKLLASATLSGSNVQFTSIPAGYRTITVVMSGMSTTLDSSFTVEYSTNNGSSYSAYFSGTSQPAPDVSSGQVVLSNYDFAVAAPVYGVAGTRSLSGQEATRFPVANPGAAINAIRVSCTAGAFDAGTVYLVGG